MVLGHAVYKVPGMVSVKGLDAFWTDPSPPDMALYSAFRQVLADRCLIRGGLLSDEGLQMLVDNAAERLAPVKRSTRGHLKLVTPKVSDFVASNTAP